VKGSTPASYKLIWLVPLPAKALIASADLIGNIASIKWFTLSEQNTSYFVVERKYGSTDFTATGNQVKAAGNSDSKSDYQMPDNIGNLMQNEVIYYRIKLVDLDGKVTYSNTVIIRLSKKPGVTIWPNPFQSSLTISITTEKETIVDIRLIDVNGKLIRNFNQKVAKGISQIAIQELGQLPGGVYLIEITDKNAGTTYQKLVKNN
jgi:Secretion system C-terminal sorting domain